jgi:hypothetical protein
VFRVLGLFVARACEGQEVGALRVGAAFHA